MINRRAKPRVLCAADILNGLDDAVCMIKKSPRVAGVTEELTDAYDRGAQHGAELLAKILLEALTETKEENP